MASRATTLLLILIAATAVVAATAALAPAPAPEAEEQSYYLVGGSKRWDIFVDYHAWARGKKFRVGDTLEFVYSPVYHNVMVVDEQSYRNCSVPSNAITYATGGDKVTLQQTGKMYFICGMPDNCGYGMKLAIDVQP